MMNFVFKTRSCVLKMMSFVFNMMKFAGRQAGWRGEGRYGSFFK